MTMFSVRNVLSISALTMLIGCGASSPPENNSQIHHTWGEISRGQAPTQKPRCPIDPSPAAKRLNLVAKIIADGNPTVFRDTLHISNICIGVDKISTQKTAKTDPSTKTITFTLKLMALAQSDSQLAAIIAHELAHISLQHAGLGEISPRVMATAEGSALSEQQKQLQNKIRELAKANAPSSDVFKVNEEFKKVSDAINTLTDKIYEEKDAHINWIEQEADEVGAELFVHAGYSIHDFANILWLSAESSPQQIVACNELIYMAWENGTERPERGNATHPTTCWRAFHLLVDEFGPSGKHKDQAAQCPHRPLS
jgi:hypothetical protein